MKPVVVLVGPPGAGKSTAGRMLAERRGLEFLETDDVVERSAGATISDIFIEQGEEAFRALEREAVLRGLRDHSGVLALGGGAVMDAEVRLRLRDHHVGFLNVGLSDAAARVGLNRDRPLLVVNPRAQLRAMLAERRPLYEEVATFTVDTDGMTPEDVVSALEAAL
jgi:shikimate kinase